MPLSSKIRFVKTTKEERNMKVILFKTNENAYLNPCKSFLQIKSIKNYQANKVVILNEPNNKIEIVIFGKKYQY